MKISVPIRVKSLLKVAAPCMVEQFLLMFVNMISIAILGHFGKEEMTASSMTNQLVTWVQCLYTGLAAGATVVIARMWGNKDKEGVKRGFMQSVVITIMLSLVVLIFTYIGQDGIVNLFFGNAEPGVLSKAHTYFAYCMIGMPAIAITTIINASVRGVGDNKTPLISSSIINIVNVGLSLVFIFGVPAMGIPSMGIVGAGIAVSIARYIGMIYTITHVLIIKSPILPKRFSLRLEKDMVSRVCNLGGTAAVDQLVFQGGFVMLQTMLISFGTEFQGGYQIASTMNGFNLAPAAALSVATTTLISQSLGKQNFIKAKEIVKATQFIVFVFFSVVSIATVIFAPWLASIYTEDVSVQREAVFFIRMFGILALPVGYFNGVSGILRGAGDGRFVAICSISGLWVLRIFVVWILAKTTNNGYLALCTGVTLDFFWRAIMYHIRLKKGSWLYIRV